MTSALSLGFISSFSFCIQRKQCQVFSNIHVLSYNTFANFMVKIFKNKLCNYIKLLGQSKSKCFTTDSEFVLMSDLHLSLLGP